MALTYTRDGAKAQLDAFDTALRARDWDGAQDALNSYTMIRQQLPLTSSFDGATQVWPDRQTLQEMIASTRETVARTNNAGRRVAVGRTGYGR